MVAQSVHLLGELIYLFAQFLNLTGNEREFITVDFLLKLLVHLLCLLLKMVGNIIESSRAQMMDGFVR